jgi:hypothetical protein
MPWGPIGGCPIWAIRGRLRGPGAKDVPQNENSEAVDEGDKELNRKLNICSGC